MTAASFYCSDQRTAKLSPVEDRRTTLGDQSQGASEVGLNEARTSLERLATRQKNGGAGPIGLDTAVGPP